jgi:Cof subfamily protein (haloacid dehalogenase superfamily)
MIRLLALDLDGTVLDSHGQLPDANRTAIARAIDAGVEVAIATGRRYDFARPIIERLPAPLTLILSNGAIVKRHDSSGRGETLLRRLLPRASARAVLAGAAEHRASAALIFDRPREGQVVFEAIDWNDRRHRLFYEANRPFVSEQSPLEDALTEDPVQLMFTGRCTAMRRLFDGLAAAPSASTSDDSGYSVALTEYEHRDFSLVDVLQAGCSKGAALSAWAAGQGLSASEVMAVGDNLNDLEMLEFAGTPVVMANAIHALTTRGWAATASNDEAGVAQAIETFVLGGASYSS